MEFDSLSREDFLKLLKEEYFRDTGSITLDQRVTFIEKLMEFLGLTANREQLTYLICNKPRVLTEACAGAGKTTISILRSVTMNMFGDTNPRKTVMLTYTTKAMKDLEWKLSELGSKLSIVDFKGLKLDCNIKVMTLHGFFHELIYEYNDLLGIHMFIGGMDANNRLKILDQGQAYYKLQDVVSTLASSGYKDIKVYPSLPRQLHSLYAQIKEKDVYERPEEWCRCSSFKEVSSISVTSLQKIYDIYEKIKAQLKTVELCEFANKVQLLLANPVILKRWRGMYTNFFVDEFQDVTEAQSKCLRMLVNGAEGLHLAAIGDGDQSIYGFRGAHSNGCFNFPKDFATGNPDDIAICYMTLNRRCPTVILDYARRIIETLNVRNPKPLNAVKQGGYFEIIKSNSYEQEAQQVYKILSKMDNAALGDTVIAYRSKRSARFIKAYLQSRGIRCKCNEHVDDLFETTLSDCFTFLNNPASMDLAKKNLYKIVPKSASFTKDCINKVLQQEELDRRAFKPPKMFYELDWSMRGDPNFPVPPESFHQELDMLRKLSLCITDSLNPDTLKNPSILLMSYLTPLILHNYIKRYYLNWQDKKMSNDGSENIFDGAGNILDEYCKSVYNSYCVQKQYRVFRQDELQRQETIANSKKVVNLSTFHSLKGLEYKTVILIDMRDNIFPGYELMLATEFGPEFIKEADDEAKRLLYVAMTRSKENLYICSRNTNPFRYEAYLTEDNVADKQDTNLEIESFTTSEFTDFLEPETPVVPNESEEPQDEVPWDEPPIQGIMLDNVSEEEESDSIFSRGTAFERWMNE